jgi:glycosyltransferase involved in cell wall biosynthesis
VLRAAWRREPYVFFHRHNHPSIWKALRDEARRFQPDVFYCDHLDSFLYRTACPGAALLVDLHNVYSTLASRTADEHSSRLTRLYLRREARLLAAIEGQAARHADALLTVSEADAAHLRSLGARSISVVPNGVDCEAYTDLPTGRGEGPPTILYVGSMAWQPNVQAAIYLAREALPQIRTAVPAARLVIVGRDPTVEVRALAHLPGVEIAGGVPDVRPYLRQAHLLAVPLESGGGTRLKILEAFAAGLPVVSTPVGCEGLRVTAEEHLLMAPRKRFAAAVTALLGDPQRGRELAARARQLVHAEYDWRRIGTSACAAVETAVQSQSGSATGSGNSELLHSVPCGSLPR